MNRTRELLDAVKAKAGISTNYALAKFLEVGEPRIHDYYKGKCNPDDYAITRIALALEMDPLVVLAEVRAESEKNGKKREFWRNFLMRTALLIGSLAVLPPSLQSTSEAAESQAMGGSRVVITVNYALRRWLRRTMQSLGRWLRPTPKSGAI